jgi:hypothetical protein
MGWSGTRHAVTNFIAPAAILFLLATAGLAGQVYGTFTYVGEMNVARSAHTATLLPNGKVLIAGGHALGLHELDSAELYDPATRKFILTGKMNSTRTRHTATLLRNGKVLIAGGISTWQALASAELYDPASGKFTPTGSMTIARAYHTATLLRNGKVLITGGSNDVTDVSNEKGITPTAELYDPATGNFAATGDMSVRRARHYAAMLVGGDVLIVGGERRGGSSNDYVSLFNFLDSAELFDLASERFNSVSRSGLIDHTPSNGSAVLLASGKVLIAGGIDNLAVVSDAKLYDPEQQKFFPTGSMTMQRFEHEATRLRDGRVLVSGGIKTLRWPWVVVSTAELYDPQRGAFVRLPDMTTRRVSHTATLLPTGEVLIAGGWRGDIALSSAELYRTAPIRRASVKGRSDLAENAIH